MKGTSLLRKWSSVSAAAAILLGTNRASATKGDLSDIQKKVSGDGDPYEPLILMPPNVKIIPENRFAGHRSHSSHSSHRSHSSHYSGSGASRTYPNYSAPSSAPPRYVPPSSYAPPRSYSTPSPPTDPVWPPPAALRTAPSAGPASRMELTNGTVIYGTLLTKSAAGITFTGSDGKSYKVARHWLTADTIATLGLPPEQSPVVETPRSAAEASTPEPKLAPQKQIPITIAPEARPSSPVEFPPLPPPEFVRLTKEFILVNSKGREVRILPIGKRLRVIARDQGGITIDSFGERFLIPIAITEPSK